VLLGASLRIRSAWAGLAAAALLLTGCTGTTTVDPGPTSPPPEPQPAAVAQLPEKSSALFTGTSAAQAALDSSARFFASATVVVLAPADDQAAQLRASSVALAIGAPVLLTGAQDEEVADEIERLGAGTVMPVGAVDLDPFDLSGMNVQPVPEDFSQLQDLLGDDLPVDLTPAKTPEKQPARHLAGLHPGTILNRAQGDGTADSTEVQRSGHIPAVLRW